ncbi:MAG TPA: hypothetical protein PKU80_13180 [Candidatus Limiplasma sp.]|nr:hypothetical protein [Candidatus Limiplasma sp.]HRX09840.1 hypothetical protein [Candidatus Limiplasma sp.]
MDDSKQNNGCQGCGHACPAHTECVEPQPLPDDVNRLQWWLEHSRRQTALLWELLPEYLDEKAQSEILNRLGRSCAQSIGWAKNYIDNPEGFFAMMLERCGEVITYDRETHVITVTTRERDCDCLLVNSGNIAPVYCNCSIGWQQYTYETILGKHVHVTVEEAVIRGDRRCVFKIRVLDERTADDH